MQNYNIENKQKFTNIPDYPIILCGFMGCGKTTIGKCIAKLSNLKFIDMDDYIIITNNKFPILNSSFPNNLPLPTQCKAITISIATILRSSMFVSLFFTFVCSFPTTSSISFPLLIIIK